MTTGKMKIEIKVSEQDFIEGLLNAKHSGSDDNHIMMFLSFYGLGAGWDYFKLTHYMNVLELNNESM